MPKDEETGKTTYQNTDFIATNKIDREFFAQYISYARRSV
jgi:hypothetical protein